MNGLYVTVCLLGVLNVGLMFWVIFNHGIRRNDKSGDGEIYIPKEIIDLYNISQREKEIALAVLEGKTNYEIAQEKYISPTTVKKHVYNLFQKTNSRNRVEFINRMRSERPKFASGFQGR